MIRHKNISNTTYPLVKRHGIFRRELSLWQAVALIVSGTIGAGVLGIPYAVAKVGLIPGIIYIAVMGVVMMMLNLLLAEVSNYTTKDAQLVGIAEKYLGQSAKWFMSVLFYASLVGALVIYIIGEGNALTALFGGHPFIWSIVFFSFMSFLILGGLKTIKTVELVLTVAILVVILIIAGWAAPHIQPAAWGYIDLSALLFPYGIILFAFHGTNAIPEARLLLKRKPRTFQKAIVLAAAITMVSYVLFAFIVVSVTGVNTTEVATVGLGEVIGPSMIFFGNLFAVLAMGTSYLLIGLSMRDSLHWDLHVKKTAATLLTLFIPLAIFFLGAKQFIGVMDFVGGVFMSLEAIMLLIIYLVVYKKLRLKHPGVRLVVVYILGAIFTFGAVQSIIHAFI
ncbi:amino acid permease [Patescibacteria group bacterium]|nr:amino acid permease [Patescibacteria group bacterium]MBU1721705.1 amino acid permease [Patescibacteria group bacterium]MBU1900832.1 amino acid permease [Patescibacteria group bacterium]